MTKLHPTAQMSLKMMNIQSANDLSRICAAVGLVQNLGALKALTTVGITEGHMKLHIKNLTMGAGASENESPLVQTRLEEILRLTKRITLSNAIEVLREIRGEFRNEFRGEFRNAVKPAAAAAVAASVVVGGGGHSAKSTQSTSIEADSAKPQASAVVSGAKISKSGSET